MLSISFLCVKSRDYHGKNVFCQIDSKDFLRPHDSNRQTILSKANDNAIIHNLNL